MVMIAIRVAVSSARSGYILLNTFTLSFLERFESILKTYLKLREKRTSPPIFTTQKIF